MGADTSVACPRCGTPRREAAACAKCGLATERMAAFSSELEATVPDAVRAAWDAALARWDDDLAHDELLRLTSLHGCYAWVAWRYRQAEEGAEDQDGRATRHLARVRRAAEVAMLSTAGARAAGPTPYKSSMVVLGVIVFLIVLGTVYARFVRVKEDTRGGARPVTTAPAPPASQVR